MSNSVNNTFNVRASLKKFALPLALTAGALTLTACEEPSDVASRNISKAADNFEIQREVVFYNGITGHFFATVNGRCSIEVDAPKDKLDVTCKHGPEDYRKHFLGRSAGVTYFVLQTEPANVSEYHTRVTFNPQGFIPDIDFRGNAAELVNPTRPDTHGQQVPQEAQPIERPAPPAAEAPASGALVPFLQGQQPG